MEGRGGGGDGEGGREEGSGRGGMTVIHIILMAPYVQTNNDEELYLYNNDVTYYVITCKSAFDWFYAAQQWYVIITFDVTHNNGT